MDSINSEKIHAMKMYKRNELLKSLFLYSFVALACLFYSSPFWFPSLASRMEVLVFVHVPKLSSLIFNSKFVFIVGNVIVVALIGESKIFSSSSSSPTKTCESYYEEYITTKQNLHKFSAPITKEFPKRENFCDVEAERVCEKNKEGKYGKISGNKVEKRVNLGVVVKRLESDLDGKENHDPCLPTEELKKRADDFIARMNKRRVYEASEYMLALCDV